MIGLPALLDTLERLAPLRLAADWDNVGLLVEGTRAVRRALLCIDATEAVVEEARAAGVDVLVAYHPPIFQGLRALREQDAVGRRILRLVRAGIHVYSPHTALDAVPGGVNDWLLEAFGRVVEVRPLEPDAQDAAAGLGRRAQLERARSFEDCVEAVKRHLRLSHVRVASPASPDFDVRSVAVCPGAGGSVLAGGADGADLLLTGEMRHHDVLAHTAAGRAVILTDHTHTERGYLPRYRDRMRATLADLHVTVSAADADPLRVR